MTTLLELWRDKKDFFVSKSYSQIIAITGEGVLKDTNNTSTEIREFLGEIPSEKLIQLTNECLSDSFKDSGLALQEAINQYGKRLGFFVHHGLYKGKRNEVGFDGIWTLKNEFSFVVEIKTTDAYRIDLDKLVRYKEKLIESGKILKDKCSILIIVGREDTGGLEAQIRGSRHSWDIRLISIDALTKLLQLRETVSDTRVLRQINEVLKPMEYTKLDALIELIFITSLNNQIEQEEQETVVKSITSSKIKKIKESDKIPPVNYHDACIEKVSRKLKTSFIKQSKSTYLSPDYNIGLTCAVSKVYETKQSESFWYAFHPHQKEFLEECKKGYVSFGCGNEKNIILFPSTEFIKLTENMYITDKGSRTYWHVKLHKINNKFEIEQPTSKSKKRIDVTKFLI